MNEQFNPEQEVPGAFWEFVEGNPGDDDVRRSLTSLPKDNVLRLFRVLLEARTELRYQFEETGRAGGASEDALDDLSEGITCEGRRAYLDCYYGRGPSPAQEGRERPRMMSHVFGEVYYQRFGTNILDDIE